MRNNNNVMKKLLILCTAVLFILSCEPQDGKTPELTMYYIQLTTDTFEGDASEQSGYYYYIDLFNKIYTEDKLPVPGTYRMVKSGNEGDFNCTDSYTWGQIKNAPDNEDLGFKSGQVTMVQTLTDHFLPEI